MSTTSSKMSSLPMVVHTDATGRLSHSELLQFESLLSTADDAMASCMETRSQYALLQNTKDTDNNTSSAILHSVLETIGVLTGESVPVINTRHAAVAWVSQSILAMRNVAVETASQSKLTPGMDPAMVASCMELITQLNTRMGGSHS